MKLVIISDIHGNLDALRALPESFDELWVLGDLVNYGPQPREVVEDLVARASLIVQGNHDHAVGHDDDSRWSARYRTMSEISRRHTAAALTEEQKAYLRDLPVHAHAEREGVRFQLTHGTPSDPHYGKCAAEDWPRELEAVEADVLLVGHSHVPFLGRFGSKTVLNPGSIGQPRAGSPEASYAVWEDGEFSLRSFAYPVEQSVEKLKRLAFPPAVEDELAMILRTGAVK
ncbi:metallophosphoesterase family protein [Bosea sp. (in: a-proteobacteria)]|uniref:metallophosphoesterase family protein n=1 Tax=Bosea sp. (in: a-proteobacteria) TaxID=1871050 RepID=UPI001AC34C83|nr:metallophosphoesterase family protein [Bosea sp. (in: a-proteobacteria)]MBN9436443.1 metallophosphoesterase family protein [Bosea sp. (in: a-proteobacteria)]